MGRYIGLLRGINVGGNNLIPMRELKACLEAGGLEDVSTYIQGGNVLFTTSEEAGLPERIGRCIRDRFEVAVDVAVLSGEQFRKVMASAPTKWGHDPSWKHNLLVALNPADVNEVLAAIGALNPAVERVSVGPGVLYQSVSVAGFRKAASGKLAAKAAYKKVTVRNYNTSRKLFELVSESERR